MVVSRGLGETRKAQQLMQELGKIKEQLDSYNSLTGMMEEWKYCYSF